MEQFDQIHRPQNNLPTFKILLLIKGILSMVFSLFPLIYVFIGLGMSQMGSMNEGDFDFPVNIFGIFTIIGSIGFLFMITLGILTILASTYIGQRRKYTFIYVVAIVNGLTGVLGIILAIFTVIELNKPDVKAEFEDSNNQRREYI